MTSHKTSRLMKRLAKADVVTALGPRKKRNRSDRGHEQHEADAASRGCAMEHAATYGVADSKDAAEGVVHTGAVISRPGGDVRQQRKRRKKHKTVDKRRIAPATRGTPALSSAVGESQVAVKGAPDPNRCTSKVDEYAEASDRHAERRASAVQQHPLACTSHDERKPKKRVPSILDVTVSSREDGPPSKIGSTDSSDGARRVDRAQLEQDVDAEMDDTLEGIIHDGSMYLVDSRSRVFSAQRDVEGEAVQVGVFDKAREVIIFSKTSSNEDQDKGCTSAAREDPDCELRRGKLPSGSDAMGEKSKGKKKKRSRGKSDGVATSDETSDPGVGAGGRDESKACPSRKRREQLTEYLFDVEDRDHCETSERAYADIAPLLRALSAHLGKSPQKLSIYDPYFCQGSAVKRLAAQGFPVVYNRNEDFYKVMDSQRLPEHDVVVTNPPFSGEHIEKILRFCARPGAKPWFLLLPNYVYLKDYYMPSLHPGDGNVSATPFFLTPPKRYSYYSPQGSRTNVKSSERKTSPFNTFWYIRVGDDPLTSKILQRYSTLVKQIDISARCYVARTPQQLPYKMMDSNDPRRKKARDRQRSIDRIRKKKQAA